MNAKSIFSLSIFSIVVFNIGFGQSKEELRQQIATLKQEKTVLSTALDNTKDEKDGLKLKLDRISEIKIDDSISPGEQPTDVVAGESGWRVELNSGKYKADLIGQLGTIWIGDENGQIQPQGGVILSKYDIEPVLINPDKEVVYKKFISKNTQFSGDGGAAFVKIKGSLNGDSYSSFTISVEGTSIIKPEYATLKIIAGEVNDLFSQGGVKGVFVCTGMHVVRYHSSQFTKSDGDGKISSPVINIDGNFFAESGEELTEYLVVRQLTQLFKPSTTTTTQLITLTTGNGSQFAIETEVQKFSPQQILFMLLKREPTFEEITGFQNNPQEFFDKYFQNISSKEKIVFDKTVEKITELPKEVTLIKSEN